MKKSIRQIIRSKGKYRKALAALTFTKKLEILEQLRQRSIDIGKSGLRRHNEGTLKDEADAKNNDNI